MNGRSLEVSARKAASTSCADCTFSVSRLIMKAMSSWIDTSPSLQHNTTSN